MNDFGIRDALFVVLLIFVIWGVMGFTIQRIWKSEQLTGTEKTFWLIGIVFMPVFGSILYFLLNPPNSSSRKP